MTTNPHAKTLKKHFGFTLAEILITLGVVGIVAALTIPTLIKSTQNAELKTAFKKAYSTLSQALAKTTSDNGNVPYQCFADYSYNYFTGDCVTFWNELTSNLKTIKSVTAKADGVDFANFTGTDLITAQGGSIINATCALGMEVTKNGNVPIYSLADGSMIRSHTLNFFILDTNGLRKPNRWGYDLFALTFIRSNANSAVVVSDRLCGAIEKDGSWINDILKN